MMQVLIDTDVILDVMIARKPFDELSKAVWEAHSEKRFVGYIAAITVLNSEYIARKHKGKETTLQALQDVLDQWNILTIEAHHLKAALSSPINDYEDAVQHICAVDANLDGIVTRNVDDFKNATLRVYTPAQFLQVLGV